MQELDLVLVPEDGKDSARRSVGGMLVALPKAAGLECACLFNSE